MRPVARSRSPSAATAAPAIAAAASVAAVATLTAAVTVIGFGVIAASGVYGSRMAWLLGGAMPLLATTMILSWLARRTTARPTTARRRTARTGPSLGRRLSRPVFLTALSLFGIPAAFAVSVLAVYALLFVHDGLSRLL
jgi:hypothetical protein